MNRKTLLTLIGFFIIGAGAVGFLLLRPFTDQKNQEQRRQPRIIIPQEIVGGQNYSAAEQMAYEDSVTAKVAMDEGEIIISILSQDFDGDPAEEQMVAFYSLHEMESPVYVSFIDYDETNGEYRRIWTIPTAATQAGTVSLFTQDLIGDRSVCVILTGMNSQDEHTMTVFRRMIGAGASFSAIAEISIDGSIKIQEKERTQAYHQGIAGDKSFAISAYGHDTNSVNMLDQLELIYTFNSEKERYEQSGVTRLPGSQIEQRRLRELLSGEKGVFENFINDLWYYVIPQGSLENRQYIYFDPESREIIFFSDETQQVFNWQNSTPTRYGLYIASQNISVSTLRRFLDIELESLDSIRVKVFEDVRLKIAVNAAWDGSYRRASTGIQLAGQSEKTLSPLINALYDSSLGRLRFFPSGEYEMSSGGEGWKGRYVFFRADDQDLLELRPEREGESRSGPPPEQRGEQGAVRMVYRVEPQPSPNETGTQPPGSGSTPDGNDGAVPQPLETLSLSRVRLSSSGIQDLHEGVIVLTRARE
ncbi:MAG: pallilysin-related adhesin [Treponema sp.]|jgi:hypothetical protein|nr:pallilysin-related adhesin [Treponema sp.]